MVWYGKDGWLEILGIQYYILYDMKRNIELNFGLKNIFLGETNVTNERYDMKRRNEPSHSSQLAGKVQQEKGGIYIFQMCTITNVFPFFSNRYTKLACHIQGFQRCCVTFGMLSWESDLYRLCMEQVLFEFDSHFSFEIIYLNLTIFCVFSWESVLPRGMMIQGLKHSFLVK